MGNGFSMGSPKIELSNATNMGLKAEVIYDVEKDPTVSRYLSRYFYKTFFAGPNFLCRTKNSFTYCASHKHFVPKNDLQCTKVFKRH